MFSKGFEVSALTCRSITRFELCLVSSLPECRFDRGTRGWLAERPFCPLQ